MDNAQTMVDVNFSSFWEEGVVTSSAKLNLTTGEVTEICVSDSPDECGYCNLINEKIEYDGLFAIVDNDNDENIYKVANAKDLFGIKAHAVALSKSINLSCFDGKLELFNHGAIITEAQAKLFKTGELKLPGHDAMDVNVKFMSFQWNQVQKRNEAIFVVTDNANRHIGDYYISSFRVTV